MKQPIAKVWTFCSDSNRDKEYETLQYADGSTSCNCPGWTRRVARDGSRSCKHTRLVDQGRADQQCVASHRYDTDANPQPTNSNTNNANRKLKTSNTSKTPRLGERKFAL